MAANILSPTAIWKDFNIPFVPSAEIIDTLKEDKATYTKLYIQGQSGGDDVTKIFATLVKPNKRIKTPAIILLQDFECGYDEKLVQAFVAQGFSVLSVDLAGESENEHFTIYPSSLSYANYKTVKDDICAVEASADKTCWYEWTRAARYALKYLTNQTFVTKVGGFASGEVATSLWHVVGTTNELACATFVLNAGWRAYRGVYKFGGDVEPQFSDDMYKFIAGIEPQAYAMHIKTPVLMLSATNSNDFDCDRACDTVARIADGVFKAVHYSVGYRERVSGEAFRSASIFFEEFLKKEHSELNQDADIACEIVNGKIDVEVTVLGTTKTVELYAAEEVTDPAKRCWQRVEDGKKHDGNVYKFEYLPYSNSMQVAFFACITFKNGFTISTKIINKKFTANDLLPSHKSKILYSSRLPYAESVFSAAEQDAETNTKINLIDKKRVQVQKGPMGIEGVGCKWGLLTFKFAAAKDKPAEDGILMFDVYAKDKGELSVRLIADYFGKKIVYTEKVKLLGGDVWQNVKIAPNRYKTAEGMGLKTYDKIDAVQFDADVEFLINNALWV